MQLSQICYVTGMDSGEYSFLIIIQHRMRSIHVKLTDLSKIDLYNFTWIFYTRLYEESAYIQFSITFLNGSILEINEWQTDRVIAKSAVHSDWTLAYNQPGVVLSVGKIFFYCKQKKSNHESCNKLSVTGDWWRSCFCLSRTEICNFQLVPFYKYNAVGKS